MEIEIVQYNRGKPKLAVNGYIYTRNRVNKNGRIAWRCQRRLTKCHGSLTTSQELQDIQDRTAHNHDSCQPEVN